MHLTSTVTSGRTVVTATGELDIATADALRGFLGEVAATGTPVVVVDLSGVDFLDSSTLGVLIGSRKLLTDRGARLDLVFAQDQVMGIFRMTGLDKVFTIYPSLTAAFTN